MSTGESFPAVPDDAGHDRGCGVPGAPGGGPETGGARRGPLPPREYEEVSEALRRDTRVSNNARGIWFCIATRPDGFTIEALVRESADGHHAIRSGINELMEHGYLVRGTRARNERGHLGVYDYLFTARAPRS
ncbi:hypothetical protein ACWDT6_19830 [Nocardia grenadensis]